MFSMNKYNGVAKQQLVSPEKKLLIQTFLQFFVQRQHGNGIGQDLSEG